MSDHEATPLTEDENAILVAIVNATKDVSKGFMFCPTAAIVGLGALNLIETNPGMMREADVATRATKKGLQHVALAQWEASKEQLAFWKEREMLLRKEVVDLFAAPDKVKGTENVTLDDGCTLKIVKKQNYNLDTDLDKVESVLDKIEAFGPEYKLVADRIVKWKAELSVTEYNMLDDLGEVGARIKASIDEVITIKDGAPTVELKEPKAKK